MEQKRCSVVTFQFNNALIKNILWNWWFRYCTFFQSYWMDRLKWVSCELRMTDIVHTSARTDNVIGPRRHNTDDLCSIYMWETIPTTNALPHDVPSNDGIYTLTLLVASSLDPLVFRSTSLAAGSLIDHTVIDVENVISASQQIFFFSSVRLFLYLLLLCRSFVCCYCVLDSNQCAPIWWS